MATIFWELAGLPLWQSEDLQSGYFFVKSTSFLVELATKMNLVIITEYVCFSR